MTRRPHLCATCHRPFPPPLVVTGPLRQRMVNINGRAEAALIALYGLHLNRIPVKQDPPPDGLRSVTT